MQNVLKMSVPNLSAVKITEIEAGEACKWLRAAGFPQYAQMYEGKRVILAVLHLTIASGVTSYHHRTLAIRNRNLVARFSNLM